MNVNATLKEIQEVLGVFREEGLVLQEPASSIIIIMYCLLVTMAGDQKKCTASYFYSNFLAFSSILNKLKCQLSVIQEQTPDSFKYE